MLEEAARIGPLPCVPERSALQKIERGIVVIEGAQARDHSERPVGRAVAQECVSEGAQDGPVFWLKVGGEELQHKRALGLPMICVNETERMQELQGVVLHARLAVLNHDAKPVEASPTVVAQI